MKNIIIGTAGHVDHGKSALIRRLTGVETDRLDEEKKRGITIDLGFAWLDLPDGGRAGIIDVPGHEKFVSNMLAGAAGMDLVMLIVAADEGVMPQTTEHLEILSLLGIPRGILVLNKIDLVDEEWQMLVEDDLRQSCKGTFLEDAPLCKVSAQTGEGIEELKQVIFQEIDKAKGKDLDRPFRLAIDRSFKKGGFGLVITGTGMEGIVHRGEDVMLYPDQVPLKVRTIQVHGEDKDEGVAGQRLAINLTGEDRGLVERGKWLAQKDSLVPTEYLEIELSLLPSSDFSVKSESQLHVHLGASEHLARIVLYGPRELHPGEKAFARLNFEEPVVAKLFDPLVLRFYSPVTTVGGGRVVDPAPPKQRLKMEERINNLTNIVKGTPAERLYLAINSGSRLFEPVHIAALRAGLDLPDEARAALEELLNDNRVIKLSETVYISDQYLDKLENKAVNVWQSFHREQPLKPGMKKEEARTRMLARQTQDIQDGVLSALLERNILRQEDNLLALTDFAIERPAELVAVEDELLKFYEARGYEPYDKEEVLTVPPMKDKAAAALKPLVKKPLKPDQVRDVILDDMVDREMLVLLTPDLFISKTYYEKAIDLVKAMIQKNGEMKLAEFRDAIDSSRKYAVAILEKLDRDKITKMRGDVRVLI